MEPVGIILLVLFLFIIVMGPLACFRMSSRFPTEKVFNPQPDQLKTARRKLSTVTTSTVLPQANPDPSADVEAPTPLSGFGECPICIGPLVPEPAHTVDNDPRPILEQVATLTSHESTSQAKTNQNIQTTEADTNVEDDILTINTCGHSFHSKCLSSWFLIERYDCPVCRVPYYQGIPRRIREGALNVTPFW